MRATLPLPASRARAYQQNQAASSLSAASLRHTSSQGGLRAAKSSASRPSTCANRTAQQVQVANKERRVEPVTSPPPIQPTSSWPLLPTEDGLASTSGFPGVCAEQAPQGHGYSVASMSAPITTSPRQSFGHACAASAYPPAKTGARAPPVQSHFSSPLQPQQYHEWRWDPSPSGTVFVTDFPAESLLTRQSSAPAVGMPEHEHFSQQVPTRMLSSPRSNPSLSPTQLERNGSQTVQLLQLRRQNQSQSPRTTTSPRGTRQAALAASSRIAKPSAPSQQAAQPSFPGCNSHGPLSWATDDWITAGGVRSPRDDRATSGSELVRSGSHPVVDEQEAAEFAGMREAGVTALQQVKQELEKLRSENANLKDKLSKAKSLHNLAQRQAEEAQSERDRERVRADSLQKSTQQLLRQLKRESARAHALERQLAATGGGHGQGELEASDPRLEVSADRGPGVDTSDSRTLDLRSPLEAGEGDALLYTDDCLPVQHGKAVEHENGFESEAGSGAGGTTAGSPVVKDFENSNYGSANLGSRPSRKSQERSSKPARRPGSPGPEHPEPLHAAAKFPESDSNGVQKSWEFVVQGQYSSEQQQDFAPKLVSCFPDDAVQKASRHGVACVCSRGRRLDRSVPNQDDFVAARHTLVHGGHIALYGVFDGHGPAGHHCAAFARGAIPESLFGQRTLLLKPEDTLREAFRQTQASLLKQPFDTAHSGTTACLALLLNLPAPQGGEAQSGEAWLFVAHVGDSRAILASSRGSETSAFTVTALTKDHRPDDEEEADRVRKHGGEIRKLRENSGAARVFMKGQDRPALALTRTLGASAALECGVTAEPDVSAYRLRPGVDVLLLLGTDGLFEFCDNSDAAAQILKEGVSDAALRSLCGASQKQWAQSSYNETVDDITAIAAATSA